MSNRQTKLSMNLNTKGLTCAKKDMISRLTKDHDIGILFCKRPTNVTPASLFLTLKPLFGTSNQRHDLATLVRNDLIPEYRPLAKPMNEECEWHTILIKNRILCNVYRPWTTTT